MSARLVTLPEEIAHVQAGAECLYEEQEVEHALDCLAALITERLAQEYPVVLCVMLGGIVTTGKLVPRLSFALQLDYLHVSRYRGKTRGGGLEWHKRASIALEGRTVLIVDDILDEGHTLAAIVEDCLRHGARRVYTAVLVEKHRAQAPVIQANFVGLTVEDRYVFGYGMDYKNHLRNLAGIYAVAGANDK